MAAQWLAGAICLLFLAEAAWRISDLEYMVTHNYSEVDKASVLFNAVNFLLFALVGGLCLLWPHISCWFHKAAADDDAKALEAKSLPKADAVKISIDEGDANDAKQPAKRQLVYLQNMKAFMTFQVVTVHTLCQFTYQCSIGVGTVAMDLAQPESMNGSSPSILTFGAFILEANQDYFMAAFFLISAYFCVKSLDRKGFRAFVIDKLVRLGGPFILYSMFLGPIVELWNDAYAGSYPLQYNYGAGPPWFILWLLNFSLIYAVVAQVLPSLHFKMPHPLLLLVLGLGLGGVFYGISSNIGDWTYLGDMMMWSYGLAIYVPFFIAGIAGGRNDWLRDHVENMATWVVWCLRIICVGFWVLIFLEFGQFTIPGLSSVHIDFNLPFGWGSLSDLWIPIYTIAMTLAMMQLFHQYLNTTFEKKWVVSVGAAAYTVYVIHIWVLSLFILIFVEILKAAKVPIVWDFSQGKPTYLTVGANGEPALLPDSYLWGGWIFVFVLTQLFVWPLAHYFRKLPVMNKMF